MAILRPEVKTVYQERRKKLVDSVLKEHGKEGKVLLCGNFEQDGVLYKQDATFYYFTGLVESSCMIMIDTASLHTTLYVPHTGNTRGAWVADVIEPTQECAERLGIDEIAYLGEQCSGYHMAPFFAEREVANIVGILAEVSKEGKAVYTTYPSSSAGYFEQRFILNRLVQFKSVIAPSLCDITREIARLRRKKSKKEIEFLYKAIKITQSAQEAAAHMISPGKFEFEIQAALEYAITSEGASMAFPSIVGSGVNSTILHYTNNTKTIEQNDLVVVDIGAQYNFYCADITRTYPASGQFSPRQREIYNLVLEVQEYVAQLAKPGMWLSNKEKPEQSLNHLARKYLADKGYDKYFMHGIGHFLGLDVHDVGDYNDPLEVGDVITIEPGIYIRGEELGVRIEDNYWIVEGGAICLSEDIPKAWDDVESMARESFTDIDKVAAGGDELSDEEFN